MYSGQTAVERTVGYLGPRGTHSEEIALGLYKGEWGQFVPFTSIDGAIRAVEVGTVTECVVPIENSLEGSVNVTLDTLAHEVNLSITKEIIWSVRHHLLVRPDTKHIHVIVSHSQALAQCRSYINQFHPNAEVKAVESTAEAAYLVASGAPNHAAIGSGRAGEIYGLESKSTDIQDNDKNCTRFVVLSKQPHDPTGERCKTSIVCQIKGEKPGSLCEMLQDFATRDVNLTRIESRPARTGLGEYIFFLDIAGTVNQDKVKSAVAAVQLKSRWFKNLGSFGVYTIQNS
ncbi:prephenate dehydratase [Sporomusaceae bacterium FL31]|nr:prephenate dehydratase [Sporomusaceae bacterium FL31]GCE34775.1 prephenate dehydratase [Sporomusaceae bacterium]